MAARTVDGVRLLEREIELERLTGAVAAARAGQGSLWVVEGRAGIGKTALLRALSEGARDGGVLVLVARASELEQQFAFGLARQLLERPVATAQAQQRDELFSGAAALAEPLLLGTEQESGPGEEALSDRGLAVVHGLYWVLVHLVAAGPALLVVDDAQWGDVASLRFLAYLATRLDALPLAVVLARRPVDGVSVPPWPAELAGDPTAVVHPPALSASGIAALLTAHLGVPPVPAFTAAAHRVTGGLPFLVGELAREMHDLSMTPSAAHAEHVGTLGPRTIARSTTARLHRLGAPALAVARAVATCGRDAGLHRIARLEELDVDLVTETLDALVGEGVLAAVDPPAFAHPIVESAIRADMPAGERGRRHRVAARLLADDGAPPERVCGHLLAAPPLGETWAVRCLLTAARQARERGDASAAVALLERALAEPPPAAQRTQVLHELGVAEAADGRVAAFRDHLEAALTTEVSPAARARIALDLGRGLCAAGEFGRAAEVMATALQESDGADPAVAAELEAQLIAISAFHPLRHIGPAAYARRRVAALEAAVDDTPADETIRAALAVVWSCRHPPVARGAEMAEGLARRVGSPRGAISVVVPCVSQALLFAGRLDLAGQVLDETIETARRAVEPLQLGWALILRSRVSLEEGRALAAETEAREAADHYQRLDPDGDVGAHAWGLAHLLEVICQRGLVPEAEDLAERWARLETVEPGYGRSLWLAARGRVRAATGDLPGGVDDLLAAGADLPSRNPRFVLWREDAVRLLAALDARREAAALAAEAVALAREFDLDAALGAALRARASTETPDTALATFEDAVSVLAGSQARLELTGALVDLGAAQRRRGHRLQARETLRTGLDDAVRGGMTRLADRARAELLAAGARPRRALLTGAEALTASERRVAAMAAAGRTNREIAQALWVSTRTVETHLTSTFTKLGVTSRHELAAHVDP